MRLTHAYLANFVALMFFLTLSPADAQQASLTNVAVPPAEKQDRQTQVIYLRNASVADVHQTISMLYNDEKQKGISVAADVRTNAIIVAGERGTIDSIAKLIEVLDSNTAAPPVLVIPNQENGIPIKRQLAEELANITEVELAFDEDLGLMMVRSPSKDRVQRFTDTLSQLTEQIAGSSQAEDGETLMRVTWLTNRQKSAADGSLVAPDDSLKATIERLATMGYKDLMVEGQLMTRCAVSATSPSFSPEFEVEGQTSGGVEFAARGNVVKRAGSNGTNAIYDAHISIQANNVVGTSLSVVVQIRTDAKPIILGSAPVLGSQSFFVVQFLKD